MEQKAQEMSGIAYACAACRVQRRKCGDNCTLAPYFPPNDTHKFSLVNKLFGTSRIVKILKDIPAEKRANAVTSIVYEASARVQDPIYGCTGIVCRLQKEVLQLETQLATAQADLRNAQPDLVSLTTRFYNAHEGGTTSDLTQNLLDHNDDIVILQDDEDLF